MYIEKYCAKCCKSRSDTLSEDCSMLTVFTIVTMCGGNLFCNGLLQKKKTNGGGLRSWFFEKTLEFFSFFTLPLEVPDKTELHPSKFHKIVLYPIEIPMPKVKTPGNSAWFFLGLAWKLCFILINLWKFHMPFLWYPWKFHIHNRPFVFFLE